MKRLKIFLRSIVFCLLLVPVAMQPVYAQVYIVTEEQLQELEAASIEREQQLELLSEPLKATEKSLKKSEANHLKTDIKVGVVSFSIGAAVGAAATIYVYNQLK